MKLSQVHEEFLKSKSQEPAFREYKGKINKYLKLYKEIQAKDAFSENRLRSFVFSDEQDCLSKYHAIMYYYYFFYIEMLNDVDKINSFPIKIAEVKEEKAKRVKGESAKSIESYLTEEFNFEELFADKYYEHLNCEDAILLVKAAISLALCAGYDSGEMFKKGKLLPKMLLEDFIAEQDYVKVKNYAGTTVPFIIIEGTCAKILKDYYDVRINKNDIEINEQALFFPQIWEAKKLNWDNNIETSKPYTAYHLVLYMLKYISRKLNLTSDLTITHLRYNMVLHSLYSTHGSSFQKIVEVFGYPQFIQKAFEKYCEEANRTTYQIFNPFFKQASSEVNKQQRNYVDGSDEAEIKTRLSIVENRIRDFGKVKEIKIKYENNCQICGEPLILFSNIKYSEVHHIQPYGKPHYGADEYSNMLVLCPNHHVLFHLGVIAISPEDLCSIIHIDKNNSLNNEKLIIIKHELSPTCVRYHYEHIFSPLLESKL